MNKIFMAVVLLMTVSTMRAQDRYLYFAWNYNQPLSNTDFIKDGTSAGAKLGYRSQIRESRFMVGVDINWATYNEYAPEETFSSPGRDFTTDYFKYVYNYGIAVSGQYTFPVGESRIITPYVGVGLGYSYNLYRIYYNVFEEEESDGGFLMRPEAGAVVKFGKRRALGLITAINYDFATSKSADYGYDNFSAFGFKLGLIVTNR
jgi:hypothetical protein